jgi:hypothetical protein
MATALGIRVAFLGRLFERKSGRSYPYVRASDINRTFRNEGIMDNRRCPEKLDVSAPSG